MRIALAVILVCVCVVMTAADRVMCPDGCTDDASGPTASEHTAAACTFCQGWSHSVIAITDGPTARLIERRPLLVANPTSRALPTPELPPKTA